MSDAINLTSGDILAVAIHRWQISDRAGCVQILKLLISSYTDGVDKLASGAAPREMMQELVAVIDGRVLIRDRVAEAPS